MFSVFTLRKLNICPIKSAVIFPCPPPFKTVHASCSWVLKIALSTTLYVRVCVCVCVCVCMCVCLSLLTRLLITSGVIWHDVDSVSLVKQGSKPLYGSCSHYQQWAWPHRNQPNKNKFLLYKLLVSLFKQLYTSTKLEHLSYKGRCGVCGLRTLIIC